MGAAAVFFKGLAFKMGWYFRRSSAAAGDLCMDAAVHGQGHGEEDLSERNYFADTLKAKNPPAFAGGFFVEEPVSLKKLKNLFKLLDGRQIVLR